MINYNLIQSIDNIIDEETNSFIGVVGAVSGMLAKRDTIAECYQSDDLSTYDIYQESTIPISEYESYEKTFNINDIKREFDIIPNMFNIFTEATAVMDKPITTNTSSSNNNAIQPKKYLPNIPMYTNNSQLLSIRNGAFSNIPAIDRRIAKLISLAFNASHEAKKDNLVVSDIKQLSDPNLQTSQGYYAKTLLSLKAIQEIAKSKTTTFKSIIINSSTGKTTDGQHNCPIVYFDAFLPKRILDADALNLFVDIDKRNEFIAKQKNALKTTRRLRETGDTTSEEYKKARSEMTDAASNVSKYYNKISSDLSSKFNISTNDLDKSIDQLAKDFCLNGMNSTSDRIRYQVSFHFGTPANAKEYNVVQQIDSMGIADSNYTNKYFQFNSKYRSRNAVIKLRDQYDLQ